MTCSDVFVDFKDSRVQVLVPVQLALGVGSNLVDCMVSVLVTYPATQPARCVWKWGPFKRGTSLPYEGGGAAVGAAFWSSNSPVYMSSSSKKNTPPQPSEKLSMEMNLFPRNLMNEVMYCITRKPTMGVKSI